MGPKPSTEQKRKIKVHWNLLNQPSKHAIEEFNMVLAKARLRVYQESLKNE